MIKYFTKPAFKNINIKIVHKIIFACFLLFGISILNLTAQPTKQWDKTIGGNSEDNMYSVRQTTDGGYILGGTSSTNINGDKTESSRGGYDYWIVKLNAAGVKEWDKTFGGNDRDMLKYVEQTSDGGYILGGESYSNASGDKSENSRGGYDFWIIKLDPIGNKEWDKTIGAIYDDFLFALQQTSDGGYILGGWTMSYQSGDMTETYKGGGGDYWVVKLSAVGTKQWDKTIGGSEYDIFRSLDQTADGGYIIGGVSGSDASFDKSENTKGDNTINPRGMFDYWVIKLNAIGVKEWDKTIGGTGFDDFQYLEHTKDGGYILGGYSDSNIGGDKSENSIGGNAIGGGDFWVVKLNAAGSKEWDKTVGTTFNDDFRSLHQTADGGYILGGNGFWIVKLNASGNKEWDKSLKGNGINLFRSLQQTNDGGYILGGASTSSIGGDKSEDCKGSYDYWVVKLSPFPTTSCTATGTILREQWNNIYGTSIAAIPVNNAPNSSSQLTLFEAPTNVADNYGSRIRGYICAPLTGSYTFWIAGDDNAELWLSTDEHAANKKKIAGFSGWTNPREWTKYAAQKSTAILLEAGHRYYIEALHKEGSGGDNLAVAWQLPGGIMEAPISSTRLSPYVPLTASCTASGTILQEQWNNISGTAITAIPVSNTPSKTAQLTSFEAPINVADNYGQRIRGFICAPATGNYTFYIASDDNSELWLSKNNNPAAKQKIAFVTGWTNAREWTKYPSQKSAVIALQANTRYYIEALHKEGTGGDNLSVGWITPGSSVIAVIPGSVLSPDTFTINTAPSVSITSPAAGATFTVPATINITANAADTGGSVAKVEFFQGATKLGEDLTAPYTFSWTGVSSGTHALTTSTSIQVTVSPAPSACSASGSILREYWANVKGSTIIDIPLTITPTSTTQLTSFEAPSNAADAYGQRIRGYICAPQTGTYTFYIAGDDNAELWLATDENPAAKQKIAYVNGWTYARQWTKYASQKSIAVVLEAGRRYYIEALHKEAYSGDNLAVGWLTPGSSVITIIPGSVLSPATTAAASTIPTNSKLDREAEMNLGTGKTFRSYPNPFTNKVTIVFAFEQQQEYTAMIYNVNGALVKALPSGTAAANTLIELEWADEKIASGLYLVRLVTNSGVQTLQVVRQ